LQWHAVVQLVEALRYKPEGSIGIFLWLNPSRRTINLGSIQYLLEGIRGRCVGLTTLQSTCADCLQILGTSAS
jgi:hypothetical protein